MTGPQQPMIAMNDAKHRRLTMYRCRIVMEKSGVVGVQNSSEKSCTAESAADGIPNFT